MWNGGNKINFYQKGKRKIKKILMLQRTWTYARTNVWLLSAGMVPLSYTEELRQSESLQNWSASRCALFDQRYAVLPNVRSNVQEKYSQGRNGAFPDMVSLPRMTPLTLRHVWLPFVGELLDHPVFLCLLLLIELRGARGLSFDYFCGVVSKLHTREGL